MNNLVKQESPQTESNQNKPKAGKLKFYFIILILFVFVFIATIICLNFFCKESTRKERVSQENKQNDALNTQKEYEQKTVLDIQKIDPIGAETPQKALEIVGTSIEEGDANKALTMFSESIQKRIKEFLESLSSERQKEFASLLKNAKLDMKITDENNVVKETYRIRMTGKKPESLIIDFTLHKLEGADNWIIFYWNKYPEDVDTIGGRTPEETLLKAATAFENNDVEKALEMFSDFDWSHDKIRHRFGGIVYGEFANSLKNAKLADENDSDLNSDFKTEIGYYLGFNIPTKLYVTKTFREGKNVPDIDYFFLTQSKDKNWSIFAFLIDNMVEPTGAATPEEALDFAASALEKGDIDKAFLMFDSDAHDDLREILDFPGEEKVLAEELRNARPMLDGEMPEIDTVKMYETDMIVSPEDKTVTIHFDINQLADGNWVIDYR